MGFALADIPLAVSPPARLTKAWVMLSVHFEVKISHFACDAQATGTLVVGCGELRGSLAVGVPVALNVWLLIDILCLFRLDILLAVSAWLFHYRTKPFRMIPFLRPRPPDRSRSGDPKFLAVSDYDFKKGRAPTSGRYLRVTVRARSRRCTKLPKGGGQGRAPTEDRRQT